jgi:predicted Zn-dependent protease
MMFSFYWRLQLIILLTVGFSSCALNPATGDLDIVTMSESKEITIGKEMHDELVKSKALYEEQKLRDYVQNVGEKLAAHSHRTELKYYFNIIDNPGVNAFALPGGYIYINRGLLAYLKNEDQLAAVLAHELGHITARHAVQQKTAKTAMSVLSVITLVGTGSADLANATHQGGEALVSGYGREHELEADRLGAEYLHNAGYDNNALLDVIEILKNQELYAKIKAKAQGRKLQTYHGLFSTHPRNDKRLQNIIANAKTLSERQRETLDPELFRNAVEGLSYGKTSKKLARSDNRFYHNKLNFTFQYPKGWEVDSGAKEIMVTEPEKTVSLRLQVKRINKNLSPREFLNKELDVKTLHRSESLLQYGLHGHTGIEPANGNQNPRRLGIFYYGSLAFIISGDTSNRKFDKDYLSVINSFRPMRRSERKRPKTLQIKYIQSQPNTRYAHLARVSKIRRNAEDELRLLNSHYPKGEPAQGEWIKVVE